MKNVLIVAAHADDEAIGCGGTISHHIANGDVVKVILVADGVSSRVGATNNDLMRRKSAAKVVQKLLGISSISCLDLPDNKLDTLPLIDIVRHIELKIQKFKPSVIYTHHHGDLNIDHQITHKAVMTAARPTPQSSVREIYGFEVLSSTEWSTPQLSPFIPNLFIDITDHMENKIRSLKAYNEEMRESPHSRSIENIKLLAHYRGYSMGIEMAEAFEVYRFIR